MAIRSGLPTKSSPCYLFWRRALIEWLRANSYWTMCGVTAITAMRGHWTFTYAACDKSSANAVTVLKQWWALATVLLGVRLLNFVYLSVASIYLTAKVAKP